MLSMLLVLAAAPQAAATPAPSLQSPTVEQLIGAGVALIPPARDGSPNMPVLSDTGFGCESRPLLANDPISPGNGLMWRDGGEPVGLYRLLDRRVNGCPDPVVVNYRVPGSNALGREAGRDPAPRPSLTPAD